ncbi:MAG TPA: hypothetical protein VM537_21440 [Anaerolineae bacterium]|nr:hypothetical protein [Anaerolineae bacterium]
MPAGSETRVAAEIEEKLRALMESLGIALPPGELRLVSPAQGAFLDLCAELGDAKLTLVQVDRGEPLLADHEYRQGIIQRIRFDGKREKSAGR